MDETQKQFIADARQIIEKLHRDLEQLRVMRLHGRQRRELAGGIFRRVHTLKGSAGSLDLELVSAIAHEVEGGVDGVRLGPLDLTQTLIRLPALASAGMKRALAGLE